LVIVGIGLLIFSFNLFYKDDAPKTIDDFHELNLEGKLKPEQGYIYGGYSFIHYDGMWYTKMISPLGSREYDITFRYGPKETENVSVSGSLNLTLFNSARTYYVTFNPLGENLQYTALAVGDFNQHMTNIFFKSPIPACDRNETKACAEISIINCTNTDELVLYVKRANETAVNVYNNCIVIEGRDFELVRAVDRILYYFYNIV